MVHKSNIADAELLFFRKICFLCRVRRLGLGSSPQPICCIGLKPKLTFGSAKLPNNRRPLMNHARRVPDFRNIVS